MNFQYKILMKSKIYLLTVEREMYCYLCEIRSATKEYIENIWSAVLGQVAALRNRRILVKLWLFFIGMPFFCFKFAESIPWLYWPTHAQKQKA